MRISDWSSDVCSSDLARRRPAPRGHRHPTRGRTRPPARACRAPPPPPAAGALRQWPTPCLPPWRRTRARCARNPGQRDGCCRGKPLASAHLLRTPGRRARPSGKWMVFPPPKDREGHHATLRTAASAVMPRLPNTISLTRRGHLPPNPASKRRAEPPKALPPYLQRITRLISPSPLIRKNYGISEPDPCQIGSESCRERVWQ